MTSEPNIGLTDEELATRFRDEGDLTCFDELARRHRSRVVAACGRILRGAEAEDAAQEVFLRVMAKIRLFQGGSFLGWLLVLTRNVCLNRVAQPGLNPLEAAREPAGGDTEMTRATEDAVRKMLALLQELPEAQRICIKLFDLDGYSYEETARLSGYPEKKVKSYLQNGRRMLKILWDERHGGRERSA